MGGGGGGGYRLHVHVLYQIHVPGRGGGEEGKNEGGRKEWREGERKCRGGRRGRTREGGRNGERERGSVGGER